MLSPEPEEDVGRRLLTRHTTPYYPYAESNNHDASVQCLLITRGGRHHIDPARLPYRQQIRYRLYQFCARTSSHGIPHLGRSHSTFYRLVWIGLLCMSLSMFLYQAWSVVMRYKRHDKITDIQLNFQTAPFPAITVCSLNPYLETLLKDVEAIKKIVRDFLKFLKPRSSSHTLHHSSSTSTTTSD